MYRKANIMFLMAETPMHAGSGDSLGIVDLPIQRERHTSFPKIEASSLKGSMREHFERQIVKEDEYKKKSEEERIKLSTENKIKAAFGDEGSQGGESSKAGCLGFTDARLLLFPVKSMKGVFAWITCPKIIAKFNEELKLAGIDKSFDIPNGNIVAIGNNLKVNTENIILEEYTFKVNKNEGEKNQVNDLGEWLALSFYNGEGYFAEKLKKDIVVLEDDDFRDFVNLSTEVITRTKIDNETGTVADGALFTEEYLPAESIMYSLVLTAPEFAEKRETFETEDKVNKFFNDFVNDNPVMQIGGNATLGKGITKIKMIN